ncbi:hypothetical protein LZ30DRAFT_126851 [Colletotrichum cereale]|nr:hypothetical protein LZ30DRAFT_126851 [Colletotrichum cereale]
MAVLGLASFHLRSDTRLRFSTGNGVAPQDGQTASPPHGSLALHRASSPFPGPLGVRMPGGRRRLQPIISRLRLPQRAFYFCYSRLALAPARVCLDTHDGVAVAASNAAVSSPVSLPSFTSNSTFCLSLILDVEYLNFVLARRGDSIHYALLFPPCLAFR